MDDIIAEFISETQEGLTELDTALIAFESRPDDRQLLDKIFRTLHTIKGTCGFLGLMRLEKVAHTAETLLDGFRSDGKMATPSDVAIILSALDQIRVLIESIQATGSEPEGDDNALVARIQVAIDRSACNDAPPVTEANAAGFEPVGPTADISTLDNPDKNSEAPSSADISNPGPDAASQYLRVNVDTLEEMLTMVSELVLTRNQLAQITKDHENNILSGPLQRLNSVVSDLQDSVMKTRMQPIGNAWVKFPRIIHDISRDLNKKIHLEMKGEEAEVDRQVLEMIKDPLMHMVRNSADHGIETPHDRISAGKPETGTITLSACHEGGYVIIEIRDDGKGISPDRVRKTVLQKGLATEDHLASLSDKQILAFIFSAGFSTAETVTAVSGRGVGMDVVRTNIEKIGGTVELESVVGKGSCFTIRIPLTLAIISALLVQHGGQEYALPQLTVQELLRISPNTKEQVEMLGNRPVLRFRDQILPLVPMSELLHFSDETSDNLNMRNCYVVIANLGTTLFGMIVDNVIGTEEIVVKPVSSILRGIPIIAGNTILGNGRVIMILDPAGIAKAGNIAATQQSRQTSMDALSSHNEADLSSLLLFRTNEGVSKAVPIFLVSRIEEFNRHTIDETGGKILVEYQGRLMELHAIDGMPETPFTKALIFSDDRSNNAFGIVVHEIEDIVEANFAIKSGTQRNGFLGTGLINGRAVDILDINYFTGEKNWIADEGALRRAQGNGGARVLIVEDSAFFRHMLKPLLLMAGYDVTMTDGPKGALKMCEKGMDFDLIVSDIEMDDMDGFAFAEKVKTQTRWKNIPMVALSSRATQQDKEKGFSKGFSAYVAKSDRDALLDTLQNVLGKTLKEEALS